MSAKTSSPHSALAEALRHSKNELMRQWRNRSVVTRLLPGLFWLLGGFALLLDVAAVGVGIGLLGGLDPFLPKSMATLLHTPAALSAAEGSHAAKSAEWTQVISNFPVLQGVTPLRLATLASLLAACLLGLSQLLRRALPRGAAALYGLSWLPLFVCIFGAGFEVCVQVRFIGPSPLSNLNEWLIWVGFLTVTLGAILELVSRRGWAALAATFAAGLFLMAAENWRGGGLATPAAGVIVSRLGMLVPSILLVASYAAFVLAWALGLLALGDPFGERYRSEARRTRGGIGGWASVVRCLRLGVTLLAMAMLLDGAWGGQSGVSLFCWQPHEIWGVSPLVLGLLLLLAHGHEWLANFGVALWTVVSLTLLAVGWMCTQPPCGVVGWGIWLGLLCLSLAAHSAHRNLFGRASAKRRSPGYPRRESYRKPAVSSS
jgi:hypothetical protein